MSGPYRESAASSVQCPRCGSETPPGDIVACVEACGIWVAADAAASAFEPSELRESRITSWFRERCNCPQCGNRMTLRGHDMSLFLGCDSHGFWVDESTVTQTGLGRIAIASRVSKARTDAKELRDRRARAEAEARDAKERAERDAAAREQARRMEELARSADEARARAARAEALRPYVELVAQAARNPVPLAEKLRELEERIGRLEAARTP